MAPIVSIVEIDRPPEEVFAYVTDPTRFPEWQHDVRGVRIDGAGPYAVGTRFTTTRRIGPSDRDMTQEVAAVEFPYRWAVRAVDGPVRPSADVTVEPLDGGARSRVTFALDFEGHGAGELLAPMVRRMARRQGPRSYRNLKELLEKG